MINLRMRNKDVSVCFRGLSLAVTEGNNRLHPPKPGQQTSGIIFETWTPAQEAGLLSNTTRLSLELPETHRSMATRPSDGWLVGQKSMVPKVTGTENHFLAAVGWMDGRSVGQSVYQPVNGSDSDRAWKPLSLYGWSIGWSVSWLISQRFRE